jgi:hypothetical protein
LIQLCVIEPHRLFECLPAFGQDVLISEDML